MEKKTYTLEEAYAEILRIKNEMGIAEYQTREQQRAFEEGYKKAVQDIVTDVSKRSFLCYINMNTNL